MDDVYYLPTPHFSPMKSSTSGSRCVLVARPHLLILTHIGYVWARNWGSYGLRYKLQRLLLVNPLSCNATPSHAPLTLILHPSHSVPICNLDTGFLGAVGMGEGHLRALAGSLAFQRCCQHVSHSSCCCVQAYAAKSLDWSLALWTLCACHELCKPECRHVLTYDL